MQRECTRILSENHTSWLERRKEELERREKLERLEKVAILKKKIVIKKKKETKKEMLTRLEKEKKEKGFNKIRSQLWRQRREKDGKLVRLWQHTEKTCLEKTCLEEEDAWLEELTLNDEERELLTKLETEYNLNKENYKLENITPEDDLYLDSIPSPCTTSVSPDAQPQPIIILQTTDDQYPPPAAPHGTAGPSHDGQPCTASDAQPQPTIILPTTDDQPPAPSPTPQLPPMPTQTWQSRQSS